MQYGTIVNIQYGTIVNVCIIYRLTPRTNNLSATLGNCLFGAVKLTKNDDIDKYRYSGYGIGFDSKGSFSHPRFYYLGA